MVDRCEALRNLEIAVGVCIADRSTGSRDISVKVSLVDESISRALVVSK